MLEKYGKYLPFLMIAVIAAVLLSALMAYLRRRKDLRALAQSQGLAFFETQDLGGAFAASGIEMLAKTAFTTSRNVIQCGFEKGGDLLFMDFISALYKSSKNRVNYTIALWQFPSGFNAPALRLRTASAALEKITAMFGKRFMKLEQHPEFSSKYTIELIGQTDENSAREFFTPALANWLSRENMEFEVSASAAVFFRRGAFNYMVRVKHYADFMSRVQELCSLIKGGRF